MPTWLGKEVNELLDLVLVQAYNTCVDQELKRTTASNNPKFTEDDREMNGKKIKKMEFAPTNPTFLELKQALETEINKRGLKI